MNKVDDIARRRDAGLLRALKTPPKSHKEMAEERARQPKRKARAKKDAR
jgi:hypothetical protein